MTSDSPDTVSYDVHDIWEHLYLGKKVKITFPDAKTRVNFRTHLHKVKAKSEEQYIALGFMQASESLSINFSREHEPEETYTIQLSTRRREAMKYTVTILE
jgi:hypothetical protein